MDVVKSLGFEQMTPVQASTIPLFSRNKDVVVEVCPFSVLYRCFFVERYGVQGRHWSRENLGIRYPRFREACTKGNKTQEERSRCSSHRPDKVRYFHAGVVRIQRDLFRV